MNAEALNRGIVMLRTVTLGLTAMVVAALTACSPDYSPNTYSSKAVQQANKVERAIVVGFREVAISSDGTVGAVEGGAAGGILGSQSGEIGLNSALGAVGGTVIGGIVGTTLEHVTSDTTGWEYIVRKDNGDLLSVTQREPTPLPIGQKVLVISGNQARIIADYSVPIETPKAAAKASADAKDTKDTKDTRETQDAKEAAPNKDAAEAKPANEPPAAAAAAATPSPPTSPAPLVAASPPANEPAATAAPTPITPAAATSEPAAPATTPDPLAPAGATTEKTTP